jgi:N-acyl-D-aspartate/D-glutamate deacylase
MFDLILSGGSVIDGTGAPAQRLDVGIAGAKIAALDDLSAAEATRRIDVTGKIVAPGFIDLHTHHDDEMDGGIEKLPEADNYLRQGVTTCVGGNCGGAAFPIGAHLERVGQLEIRQNYAVLFGCNTSRSAVLNEARPATPDELARMCDLVRKGFDDGAIGLSSGVRYLPFLTTHELVEMSKVAGRYDSFYVSHIRNEGEGLVEAVEELIEVARQAGVPGQVSHVKCYGRANWGKSTRVRELIEDACEQGLDISADQYPYTGCFTGLAGTLFGQETMWRTGKLGGTQHLLGELRAEAEANFRGSVERLGGAGNVILAPHKPHPEFQGKTLAEYWDMKGGDPFEVTVELVSGADHISAIYMAMCEEDIRTFMQSDRTMVGSDGHLRVFGKSFSHPRNFGTFPRVLARYVREQKVVSLEEAVRKMTSFPAQRLGFRKRGRLARGMVADVTVFDPDTIEDTATFREGNSYPKGIELVLLAGNVALEDDTPTARRFGRVIRRGGS